MFLAVIRILLIIFAQGKKRRGMPERPVDLVKQWIVWQKMLFNLGAGWISDSVLILFGVPLIIQEGYIYGIALLILKYFTGLAAYYMQLPQIENELALRKMNPYMDRKLDNNAEKEKQEC